MTSESLIKLSALQKNVSFITLKDHKQNFTNNPKCRLINPAKPELGKVSKMFLEKINKSIRESTKVHQWHNSEDVITWFNDIQSKPTRMFVQFDIVEFYPSITETLLEKSLTFAKQFVNIPESDEKITSENLFSSQMVAVGPKVKETPILTSPWGVTMVPNSVN